MQCTANGNRRRIKPRQAAAPTALSAVAQFADNRIGKGVKNQRRHDNGPDQRSIQSHNLIIEDQQKNRKAIVLYAIGDGTQSVKNLERRRKVMGGGHTARKNASLATNRMIELSCECRHARAEAWPVNRHRLDVTASIACR